MPPFARSSTVLALIFGAFKSTFFIFFSFKHCFLAEPISEPSRCDFRQPYRANGPSPVLRFCPLAPSWPASSKIEQNNSQLTFTDLMHCDCFIYMVFISRNAFFNKLKIEDFSFNGFCALLISCFFVFTKNECLDGWFYCEVWFSNTLSGETPVFFPRTPRPRPQKSLPKGL